MKKARPLVCVLLFGALGGVVGFLAGQFTGLSRSPVGGDPRLPYPHVVPKSDGVASLRFAMVHDVIHERFPKHGTAFYKERNRRTRLALDELKPQLTAGRPPQRYFELLDDLGVGLEMVGEHDAAIKLMRDKLKQQLDHKLPEPELYSTYANLGTFLILGPFRQVRPGNEADKATLREGLGCIQTAIRINPNSHFGREVWQAVIIEYMIALYDNPNVLLQFDMVGNRMDAEVDVRARQPVVPGEDGVRYAREAAAYLRHPDWKAHEGARQGITRIGADDGWTRAANSTHKSPVPFDEPTMGIVGMWRLGGGAHPYFAVALAETMLRVGQPTLAWCGYERAAQIAKFTWPDPDLQSRFTAHCRKRQAAVAATLPADTVAQLKPNFEKELALGQEYQKNYQRSEEERIAAGASIEDPHFHDEFNRRNPPIASPVGDADGFVVRRPWIASWGATLTFLFAGAFALAAAIWAWVAARR